MRRRMRGLAASALAVAALAAAGAADAASCALQTPAVSPLSYVYTADTSFEVSVTLICSSFTTGESVSPSLSVGAGGSGDALNRHMSGSGANALSYNLYTTSAHTSVVGDGSNGASALDMPTASSTQTSSSVTLFGDIPSGQANVSAGSGYSDSLALTVSY